ncbi:hypothetical protein BGW36DRAFT_295630 [Talaromyces proteolyticus]|uniref:Zn(2)-C6 fungal-type domain-containing protein n=1 Tax=Talaromyces proteolyticus TaxID=1131652 RepID=A0AAD4PYC1_9EURO|nr:uncharacterized protein BGW36DRAFT_295630 [Talaromyces proteolyticus]KAH8697589.1 hypothetical protein BGW36DRAFT_295630 [Talaromyces proteolyticus]
MVGVGGRSKACDNCRRRRVKCDERKPKCERCAKAKLECGGYQEMTIIQFDGRQRRKLSPSLDSNISATTRSALLPIKEFVRSDWTLGAHLPICTDDIFVEYTRSRLLQGQEVDDPVVLPSTVDRPLVQKSFLALSTTFFGLEHKEKELVSQGFRRYGVALEYLRQAVGDPSRYTSFDLIESIMVMSLFEFLISENENGWISHALGLEKIMALRGPESFKKYPEIIMLQNSRMCIILASILLRRRTILSQPEWKSIPWSLEPQAKSGMQFLVDILADFPELFVEKEDIVSNNSFDYRVMKWGHLRSKVDHVLHQLADWEQDWNMKNPGCCRQVPAPPTTPTVINALGLSIPAWETIIEYESLYHANTVIVYNATLIMAQRLAQTIAFSGELHHPSALNAAELSDRNLAAGLIICRSIEYHLESMRKGAGSFFLLFPLRMAHDAIGNSNSIIGAWLQDVLQEIQDGKSGRWATAKYLLDLQPQLNGKKATGI